MAGKSLNDMIARIVSELGQRADLGPGGAYPTVITNAIFDAVQICAKERFRFNESRPLSPIQFNTIAGQPYYDVTTVPQMPLLFKIDYVNYLLGQTTQRMERLFPEEIYLALLQGATAGPPATFAWDGQSIILYPNPNIPYLITIGGYMAAPAPTDPTDITNVWMNDAERLIRSYAKYIIARDFTRNDKMVQAMSPLPPQPGEDGHAAYWAYCELNGEINKIRGTGRIRGMKF